MAAYKTDQCRLVHRGVEFHFVSYEGQVPKPATDGVVTPPMWYLMRSGHRHAVMPQVPGQPEAERDRGFAEWLDANVFGPRARARAG